MKRSVYIARGPYQTIRSTMLQLSFRRLLMTNRTCCACASRVINGFLEQLISERVEASHSHPHNLSGNRSGPAPTCTSPVQLISFINNRDNNQICHIKYLIAEKLMTEAHGLAYYACSRGQAK